MTKARVILILEEKEGNNLTWAFNSEAMLILNKLETN